MNKKIGKLFREPLGLLTLIFNLLFILFCLFQVLYFKHYLKQSLTSKIESTLDQVEGKLSDYVRFLENFYKIPFIPEFAELPESKGWLLELVDFLEDLFKKEHFLSLAIFYQKKHLLSWNYKERNIPFKECQNQIVEEGNLLKALRKATIENKEYCIYLTLDISYYKGTLKKYLFINLFFCLLTLAVVFYLFLRFTEAEERKREAEMKLQAERELAFLGRMAATLAHELRNSLNNLFLLLQASTSSSENPLQKQILNEVKSLLNWTQEILLFHKEIKISPEYFNPEDLLLELKLFAAQSGKKVELQIENKVDRIFGDPFWLKKAFENLVKNALQAVPEGGQISLTLRKEHQTYIFEVYDSGEPILDELKKKIFEPFYSTKKEGFGLGLYLVKKIIEAHQGGIEIENLKENGKIFRIFWKEP
ncbi:MAG: sensor histidine kinase [Caldimicrobium sp.]